MHNQKGMRVVIGSFEPGTLSCPEQRGSVTGLRRYTLNGNAAGGTTSAADPAGKYGLIITPSERYIDGLTWYRLGAKVSKFRSASRKFLVLESEKSTDETLSKWPHNDLPTTWSLGDSLPGRPAWSGAYGSFAFRHPYSRGMNALFVDGHVELMRPGDELNWSWRFTPEAR
jgi:prepilin-type processing-associated H-X9-DG protein